METLEKNVAQFNNEISDLQKLHSRYIRAIDEMKDKQTACVKALKHERNYVKAIRTSIKELKKTANENEQARLKEIADDLNNKEFLLRDIGDVLPKSNGIYLNIVLGSVDISFTSKQDKFLYKQDYEKFKIVVSAISATISFLLYFFISNRIMDIAFHFLLVWYYCTLTIREQILIANGSRIKGWWCINHFISTVLSAIMLLWPFSQSYDEFRDQFMLFTLYLNIIHCVQYHYQKASLYKLRALGMGHSMDITVDGFKSWMFRQLQFILPLLFGAYAFQLYNAYTLFSIIKQPYCKEWQAVVVALILFVQFSGNLSTTFLVIWQKFFSRQQAGERQHLQAKYSFVPPKNELSKTNISSSSRNLHTAVDLVKGDCPEGTLHPLINNVITKSSSNEILNQELDVIKMRQSAVSNTPLGPRNSSAASLISHGFSVLQSPNNPGSCEVRLKDTTQVPVDIKKAQ